MGGGWGNEESFSDYTVLYVLLDERKDNTDQFGCLLMLNR